MSSDLLGIRSLSFLGSSLLYSTFANLSTLFFAFLLTFFRVVARPVFVAFSDAAWIGRAAGAGADPPGTGPRGEGRSGKRGGITPTNSHENKNSMLKTALKKSPKK